MDNCELIKKALFHILSEKTVSLDRVKTYFDENYIQTVDGKTIHFNDFFNHLISLKTATKSISVDIKSIAENGNFVHTYHMIKAIKQDNSISEFQVFACFKIEDQKIISCEELTRMIKGHKHDEDLGSRV